MNQKLIWLIATACVIYANLGQAMAIPAYPYPITHTQSDGTQITIRIYGDEYKSQILSQDGYTLLSGPNRDYYYATLADDGTLVRTSIAAKPIGLLSATDRAVVSSLKKGLTSMMPAVQRTPSYNSRSRGEIYLSSVNEVVDGMKVPPRITETHPIGKLPSLVILGEFSDVKFSAADPVTHFHRLLMEKGYSDNGATGSAHDYYFENSNGQFDPDFIVVGPFTASKELTYYGLSVNGNQRNAPQFIKEVIQKAANEVDLSPYTNADGIVRDLFIFYPGGNPADGSDPNNIWPHRSEFRPSSDLNFNGSQIKGYACTSELRIGMQSCGIGIFCHEFGHVIGWPDLYDTDYEGSGGTAYGIDRYSLMAAGGYNNNGRTPPAISIFERWLAGWEEPQVFTSSGTYEIEPVTDGKGYIIPSRSANDYFIVEYRGTNKNVWDQSQFIGNGSGMIVYHVDNTDKNANRWFGESQLSNTINVDPAHECYKLIQSVPSSRPNVSKIFFPGSANITTLTASSNSTYQAWDGEKALINFENIAIKDGKLVVDILRLSGPAIKCKIEAFQHDALVSWSDPQGSSWTVTLFDTKGTQISQQTVEQPSLHLKGLQPSSNYTLIIEGVDVKGEPWAQDYTLTTQSRGGNARLGFTTSQFSKDQPILFTVLDYTGTYKEIQWYVDDQLTTKIDGTLPVGDHTIKAVITNENNTKEYFIKYITVK